VVLKACEGLIKFIIGNTKKAFSVGMFNKFAGLLCRNILRNVFGQLDPNKYNGGSLVGLRGVVIKSHGGANEDAFFNAIKVALIEAEHNVPEKISERVATLLQEVL
jgi:glycerol-3-phosphate acyltransferase PlsX